MANKSSYAWYLICFNPMKPTGKFHFKIYMVCCAESNLTLRIKIHTKDNADREEERNYDDFINKLDNLTLELCHPFFQSGTTINMTIIICPLHVLLSCGRMVYFVGVPFEVLGNMSLKGFSLTPARAALWHVEHIAWQ